MVNEFDKEIDAMLRNLAKGDSFAQVSAHPHLDADELSAFAENALPQKARLRMIEHLADCTNCRKILANTVLLNSEEESEIIHEEIKTIVALPAIPWYQSLFAFPKLSYAMGGLALLFCGMIGLMVWQNSQNSEPMLAQKPKTSDKTYNTGGASSEGDAPVSEVYASNSVANAPMAMGTPMANSSGLPVANSAAKENVPTSSADSETAAKPALKTGEDSLADSKIADGDTPVATKSAPITEGAKGGEEAKSVATPTNEPVDNAVNERSDKNEVSQTQVQNIQNVSPDSGNVRRSQNPPPAPSTAAGASRESEKQSEPPKAKKKMPEKSDEVNKDSSAETRRVSGKSFRKVDGGWTDTSYSGGQMTTVRRGSGDYQKLDSGLQNVGNSLSGTVVVVWGGKNYKIQ